MIYKHFQCTSQIPCSERINSLLMVSGRKVVLAFQLWESVSDADYRCSAGVASWVVPRPIYGVRCFLTATSDHHFGETGARTNPILIGGLSLMVRPTPPYPTPTRLAPPRRTPAHPTLPYPRGPRPATDRQPHAWARPGPGALLWVT